MDYVAAREAFFQPRDADAAPAGTSQWTSPARQLREPIEPIATVCYSYFGGAWLGGSAELEGIPGTTGQLDPY